MTTEEYKRTSSKGFRGQTIIFTNARARCHTIADALGMRAAAYHAGLDFAGTPGCGDPVP